MSPHDLRDPITIASVLVRDHLDTQQDEQDTRVDGVPGVGHGDLPRPPTEKAASDKPDWWTSDEWSTPLDVFQRIERVYGPFDLDACCRPETAKAGRYFTKDDDALSQPWTGRVWVNPPYSNPRPWISAAVSAVQSGDARRVVMLLPAATDTAWFHELVLPYADVVFMKGRVKFIGWQGTPIGSPKAGTILAIFPKLSAAFSLRDAGATLPVAIREESA